MEAIQDHAWRAAVLRRRGDPGAATEERLAFAGLRGAILDQARASVPRPQCNVLADQIVWGRAPARLDFGGSWTDTPPHCLQHGGGVVNAAVDLNGQPPIQVFAKLCATPEIVIRSIDLGIEHRFSSHEQIATYGQLGSEFTLAKAALALAGFLPSFFGATGALDLRRQLQDFGGGIELSLLAAIPQGSGLGASSILAATILGALNVLCGLNWDAQKIIANTLVIEQMLTTGGGWQDQAGGVLHGVKFCKTAPGMRQCITPRWLPDALLSELRASRTMLLYYTGITRLAKNILQEIVRGMFLNSAERLGILRQIGENADFVADAIQRNDQGAFCEGIRRSWDLNRRLDAGTCPPEVQAILDPIEDYLAATKLLGAGGGGYMILLAKDDEAAAKIRRKLESEPPNAKARFVDFSVSRVGLEVTRS
jgi:galactokinase/mevalonate kinase-like predicted kinase